MKNHFLLATIAIAAFVQPVGALEIQRVEPTPLFPKPAEGQPLRQLGRVHVDNPGPPVTVFARVTVGTQAPETRGPGSVGKGKAVVDILVPDIAAPTPVMIELVDNTGKVLAAKKLDWQPQKKWTVYCCSYSHQDLGYGDYPHRLRTSIRHANINLPLQFCRDTDNWPDDSKYRWNIETSEPLTSFISFNGKDAARELAKRMREGRIALGRVHNTANTEELSRELMARLFYMSGRHAVDLLGVPPNKTIQIDDVIGITCPLAIYAAEADATYFFHGFNGFGGMGHCEKPAESEPVFYWQVPGGSGRVLERATPYGGVSGDSPGDCSEGHILGYINAVAAHWPFDALLMPEGDDFKPATRHLANHIHDWNAKWAFPRLVCGTMDMFFEAVAKQAKPTDIKTCAADSNNLWADQDYAAARATGQARKLNEQLPATETLASIAQALAGGGGQWINTFAGYHRLLQYWEHTNSKNLPYGNMAWYETELEENREMVTEAAGQQQQVFTNASQRLASVITRTGEKNLIVFNPLPYTRTDIVRAEIPAATVVDDTGKETAVQQLSDGTAMFVATDIPATGYKTYSLDGGPRSVVAAAAGKLESKLYRIQFNPTTGALTSLFDKTLGVELIETNAPHAFNEYLYEFRTHTGGLNFDSVWSRMAKANSVSVERGPVADVLTVTGHANGVRALKQTVILYHGLPRVDFSIWMDKSPCPITLEPQGAGNTLDRKQKEGVFVALPLAVPNFTIHHELPGAVIEPYRQQFQGSATAHHAVQSFTDLSNDKFGVTVSPIEGSLVCYGAPISSPVVIDGEGHYKRDQTYPVTSRLYLYLLNNMFDVNIAGNQQGPVSFQWALRSHAGDWKTGGADRFGRSVLQPLLAWRADGKNTGTLPASASFMTVDAPNVMCSVIKPAEANGRGFIIRLNETTGRETTTTVSLPMLPAIESVKETSLVENDRAEIGKGNTFQVTLPKFGVKTYRVTCDGKPISVTGINAKAVADMQVDLSWKSEGVSHCNIYRDTQPDCAPTQLNFIGQSATGNFTDSPRPNIGGWLRSCLAPKTAYYYRVVPVDRANNPGTPSAVVTVTTPEQPNLSPVAVEGLRALLVSPISNDNFVNLLFRTACEPDVAQYEIFRDGVLAGTVNSDDVPSRSGGYGEIHLYKVKEYDHATFADKTVAPSTTYHYKVRAVDAAGQKGVFSEEVSIRTKEAASKMSAQSVYSPAFGAANAMDSALDPDHAWISKPYGGGTKDKPLDVWWSIEFPKPTVPIAGVKLIGDHRDVIPLQPALQVQVLTNGTWKTVAEVKDAKDKDITVNFTQPVSVVGVRIFVPAADLPKSPQRAGTDRIVRICELLLIMPDGTAKGIE